MANYDGVFYTYLFLRPVEFNSSPEHWTTTEELLASSLTLRSVYLLLFTFTARYSHYLHLLLYWFTTLPSSTTFEIVPNGYQLFLYVVIDILNIVYIS